MSTHQPDPSADDKSVHAVVERPPSRRSPRRGRRVAGAVVAAVASLSLAKTAHAQAWNETSGNWSAAANWTPAGVPAGAATTALVFGGSAAHTATLDVGTAAATFTANTLTFANTSAAGVTLAVAGTRTITLNGSSPPGLVQNGTGPVAINGTLLLLDAVGPTGANGTTTFSGTGTGDLSVAEVRYNVNNSPALALTGAHNVNVGSFYKQQGNKTINNALPAGKVLTIGAINLQTNNANNTLAFTGNGDTVVTGAIAPTLGASGTNGGTLTKAGTGTLTLGGNSAFTGSVTVSAGALNVSNLAAGGNLGSGTSAVVLGAAATEGTFNYAGPTATFARGFGVGAGGARVNAATAGQTLTIDSPLGLSGTGTLKVGGAGDTVINNAVRLGAGGLTKLDAGTLTLNAAGTYAGATTVAGGKLVVGRPGTGALTGGVVDGVTSGAARVVSVRKDGAGTWTLAGANAYTGTTTVTAGTLLVAAGGTLGTGVATVSGTGTLGGTGSIAGPLQVTGGTVAPGGSPSGAASPGVLTLAAGLSFAGGTLSVDVKGTTAGTGYDQLLVTGGDVSLGAGVAALKVAAGYVPAAGDRIWIVNNAGTGATTGFFADAAAGPLAEGAVLALSGRAFEVHYAANLDAAELTGGNDVVLVAAVVPEPSFAPAGLAAATAGLLSRRRGHRRPRPPGRSR
jgi:fibronectin-binding autotransporter adhesin